MLHFGTTNNKKVVLSQGNRVMPQLLFRYKVHQQYKYKRCQALKATLHELQTCRRKTEFNAKWLLKVIQGHAFWRQWKGDEGLSNTKY